MTSARDASMVVSSGRGATRAASAPHKSSAMRAPSTTIVARSARTSSPHGVTTIPPRIRSAILALHRQLGAGHRPPPLEHEAEPAPILEHADIREGIAVHDEEVGEGAGDQRAHYALAVDRAGGHAGGRADRLVRAHALPHHELELPRILAV